MIGSYCIRKMIGQTWKELHGLPKVKTEGMIFSAQLVMEEEDKTLEAPMEICS
jgi:hypothetical protein